MPSRVDAIINHDLLVWARESIGLDIEDAAKKIGVKPERLETMGKRRKEAHHKTVAQSFSSLQKAVSRLLPTGSSQVV